MTTSYADTYAAAYVYRHAAAPHSLHAVSFFVTVLESPTFCSRT